MKKKFFSLPETNADLESENVLIGRTKRKPNDEDVEIDGGVTERVDTKAPKHINSKTIIMFSAEMSTVADVEDEYCGYVYNLNAVLENGTVKGNYKSRDRFGYAFEQSFSESAEFMNSLYLIVNEYEFSRYNGRNSFVAGLPDNYGFSVDISFASGERIYASDNQSNLIPRDAVIKLVDLFESRAVSISDWTEMEFSRNHPDWDACFSVQVKKDGIGNMFAEGYLVSNGNEYSFDEEFRVSAETADALNRMNLSSLPKLKKSSELLHAEDSPEQKLILSYGKKEVSKELDDNTLVSVFGVLLAEFIKQHGGA